jgi:hypothetical protein
VVKTFPVTQQYSHKAISGSCRGQRAEWWLSSHLMPLLTEHVDNLA